MAVKTRGGINIIYLNGETMTKLLTTLIERSINIIGKEMFEKVMIAGGGVFLIDKTYTIDLVCMFNKDALDEKDRDIEEAIENNYTLYAVYVGGEPNLKLTGCKITKENRAEIFHTMKECLPGGPL